MGGSKEEGSIDTLEKLIQAIHVPVSNWDLFLVGDGSGSKWNNPGGWACAMIMRDRETEAIHYVTPFVGAVSRGSINWLEAMPYWHCLRHHYYEMDGSILAKEGSGVEVHIVSDSEWVVKSMSGRFRTKVHGDMLVLFNYFKSKGYRLWWHHFHREVVKLNSIVDQLAVNAREYINAIEYPVVSDEFPITDEK